MRLGIDVGSTTVKLVLIDDKDKIIYEKYERHMSSVFSKVSELLRQLMTEKGDIKVKAVITGSGGLALAETIKSRFEQEVITCSLAVEKIIPQTGKNPIFRRICKRRRKRQQRKKQRMPDVWQRRKTVIPSGNTTMRKWPGCCTRQWRSGAPSCRRHSGRKPNG